MVAARDRRGGTSHTIMIAAFYLTTLVNSPGVIATKLKYAEAFSKVAWREFPGGRYKASTNATLTATTIAGAITELKPGGVRELHWHDAIEWAMVTKGTCMATVVDRGEIHPTDTWNFTVGDVWYFPSNLPHGIIGLEPEGCQFVSGFKSPDFDELNALSASTWFATVPVETLAQSLDISIDSARYISQKAKSNSPTFIQQGRVQEVTSQKPSLPLQWPENIHRFPMMQNTYVVTNDDGSSINKVDVARFPISTEMAGAILTIGPGGMRQMHWHLNLDEWQYVMQGQVEVGVFVAPGESSTAVIGPGDVGFAPRGSGHYLRNVGKGPAQVLLILNDGDFTNVDVNHFLGTVPPSWVAASLGISTEKAREINYDLPWFAPVGKAAAIAVAASRHL